MDIAAREADDTKWRKRQRRFFNICGIIMFSCIVALSFIGAFGIHKGEWLPGTHPITYAILMVIMFIFCFSLGVVLMGMQMQRGISKIVDEGRNYPSE